MVAPHGCHRLGWRSTARTPEATLYFGGDWCVGPLIEDAWNSGTAIAADLLAHTI
jgi:predicted NAD/FAD-dependent oxidoreductase